MIDEAVSRWLRRLEGETDAALRWAGAGSGPPGCSTADLDEPAYRAGVFEGLRLLSALRDQDVGSPSHREAVVTVLRRRVRRARIGCSLHPNWWRARRTARGTKPGPGSTAASPFVRGVVCAALYELHPDRSIVLSDEERSAAQQQWTDALVALRRPSRAPHTAGRA